MALKLIVLAVQSTGDYKKLSLLIPKGLHTSLKKFALEKDSTVTAVIIELITELVNNESPKLTEKNKPFEVTL